MSHDDDPRAEQEDKRTRHLHPGAGESLAREPPAPEPLPETIGPFRILRLLGQGGMGKVFLAQQSTPVERQVALKVVRSRFLDEESTVRFAAERQAMARLQHPNVAQIFEAGATAEGHPYFVMEYVDGERITRYCDRRGLSIEARLELFRDVCSGVQHAHQKSILHRDLKPSNVLVAEIEGRPSPKIIDFGIAKAIDQPLVDSTLVTRDRLIGTPAYLSPEAAQVGDAPLDLDTRTDVYSLGILLYELLVGKRPFDHRKDSLFQVLHRIAAEDAPGPSTRWSQLDASDRERLAEQRRLDPATLRKRLRGDLDWIVLKAIAKDRRERYDSAAELAGDLERHLGHLPVSAGPLSATYRVRKFVRRRIGVVVAATLLLIALAGGVVARSIEAERANREAAAAIAARHEAEIALERAEAARAEAAEISQFLTGLFQVSDPGEAKGNSVTARELLDNAAEKVRHGFMGQPLARARFMQSIGDVYRKLGLYAQAQELLEDALTIRKTHLPSDHLDVAETLNGLGALHAQLGRFEAAVPLFREVLAIRERALGENDPKLAASLNNLANLYSEMARGDEAEALYLRSIAIAQAQEAEEEDSPSPDLMVALNNLAALYTDVGRFAEAEPLLRSFLDHMRAEHGEYHPHVAVALVNLAEIRWKQSSPGEAEALYREACDIVRSVLGADHADMGYCLGSLAALLRDQGRPVEAEALFRQAMAIQVATLPRDHPERQATEDGLAELLRSLGRPEEE